MLENESINLPSDAESIEACDPALTRKEFLTKLVRRAAIAGSIVAAPKVLDKFLVPPVYALTSTQHFHDSHDPLRTQPGGTFDGNPHHGGRKALPEDNGGWG
ncbi:MAG TPA: hypothetical protein V6C72_06515 [Chroococcales cyanobacterium]